MSSRPHRHHWRGGFRSRRFESLRHTVAARLQIALPNYVLLIPLPSTAICRFPRPRESSDLAHFLYRFVGEFSRDVSLCCAVPIMPQIRLEIKRPCGCYALASRLLLFFKGHLGISLFRIGQRKLLLRPRKYGNLTKKHGDDTKEWLHL